MYPSINSSYELLVYRQRKKSHCVTKTRLQYHSLMSFPLRWSPTYLTLSIFATTTVARTQLLHSLRVCSDAFIHKTILAVCPRLLFVLLACFPCKKDIWGKKKNQYSMGWFVCWMLFQICANTILYTIFNLWCSIVWAERNVIFQ